MTIHGGVTELSPVKYSKKKYYNKILLLENLSDGKKTMWMVLFQPQLRSQLYESLDAAM